MSEMYKPALVFHLLTPVFNTVINILGLGVPFKRRVLSLVDIDGQNLKVLDIGSGTGTFIIEAKKLHPQIEAVGIDPDLKILRIAQNKARKAAVEVRLQQGYAQELPFPSDSQPA